MIAGHPHHRSIEPDDEIGFLEKNAAFGTRSGATLRLVRVACSV